MVPPRPRGVPLMWLSEGQGGGAGGGDACDALFFGGTGVVCCAFFLVGGGVLCCAIFEGAGVAWRAGRRRRRGALSLFREC